MKTMDFSNIEYLRQGTPKQQMAYEVLTASGIMKILADFDPILTGTVPLAIDTDLSDLDIICHFSQIASFRELLFQQFSSMEDFTLLERKLQGSPSVLANFRLQEFPVEVFGQAIASRNQWAYRHMVIEFEILRQKGEPFRRQVVALKNSGLKTEPAFALLLGLEGDPYEGLLKYGQQFLKEKDTFR